MHKFKTVIQAITLAVLTVVFSACGDKADKQANDAAPPSASVSSLPTANDVQAALAECDKLPDPKPTEDSPTARSTAVSLGIAARRECKHQIELKASNSDLARIREIKEKEQSDLAQRNASEREWRKGIQQGGKAPLREFKY